MKPSELVAAAKRKTGAATEYQLAKITTVSRAHLSHFVNNARWPDNNAARLLAEAAALDPLAVIGELEISKATDEATRTAWGKALARQILKPEGFALPGLLFWLSPISAVLSFEGLATFKIALRIMSKKVKRKAECLTHETKSGCYNGPGLKTALLSW